MFFLVNLFFILMAIFFKKPFYLFILFFYFQELLAFIFLFSFNINFTFFVIILKGGFGPFFLFYLFLLPYLNGFLFFYFIF